MNWDNFITRATLIVLAVWKLATAALIVTLLFALFDAISLTISTTIWLVAGWALLGLLGFFSIELCIGTTGGCAIDIEDEMEWEEEQKNKALNEPKLKEHDENEKLDQILDEERKRRENE